MSEPTEHKKWFAPGFHARIVGARSVVREIFPKLRYELLEPHSQQLVRRAWAARATKALPDDEKISFKQRCPGWTGRINRKQWPCNHPLCPFCWARRTAITYIRWRRFFLFNKRFYGNKPVTLFEVSGNKIVDPSEWRAAMKAKLWSGPTPLAFSRVIVPDFWDREWRIRYAALIAVSDITKYHSFLPHKVWPDTSVIFMRDGLARLMAYPAGWLNGEYDLPSMWPLVSNLRIHWVSKLPHLDEDPTDGEGEELVHANAKVTPKKVTAAPKKEAAKKEAKVVSKPKRKPKKSKGQLDAKVSEAPSQSPSAEVTAWRPRPRRKVKWP